MFTGHSGNAGAGFNALVVCQEVVILVICQSRLWCCDSEKRVGSMLHEEVAMRLMCVRIRVAIAVWC
jgi:hypothetical protein